MTEERPIALVMGAAGGIGQAVASALADRYRVGLAGRDEVALRKLAETLPEAFCWRVDLSRGRTISEMPSELSRLSLFVNCAGLFAYGTIADTSMEVWQDLFSANLFGFVEVTRLVLPALRAARGRVIVVNSTAVSGSPAKRAAYAASKVAVRTFTEALHQEELENGIRVTSVYPGRVATKTQQAVRLAEGGPYDPESYLSPASVAAAILWVVLSPDDSHITQFEVKPVWH